MSRYKIVWYKVPEICIGGPFTVLALRDDGTTASRCAFIETEERASARAHEYARQYANDGQPAPVSRIVADGETS